MENITRLTAVFILCAGGIASMVSNANANTAADNVRLSATPLANSAYGNECTNRSIQPFARSKDSTFSDDALRAGLELLTGVASGGYHSGPSNVCGKNSAL
ncbi:hypothetical protein [Burkholderia sp. PAMC 26561]|uniref:hypothetical protein n=1 Tax=Burkholderia sp. PAMC 26561 TaxID=1795043 RepID=UPI00076B61C4|nr:hypothetical protein [Burkholderia sp. PAMC 26561]AME24230.1 hypothetical protein AXG89_10620 [Burkholderia sp. PAMC 26561]